MAAVRVLLLWFACALPAASQNPEVEKRTAALAHELRCLVCQNQTLADSNAPLAVDLRNQIREQLAAGKSEQDVLDFMVARYGDFVLYRPPLKAATLALWIGPFVFLVLGVWLLARRLARRRAAEPELSGAERERAAKLLE
jgi:cytochrome c-type biogenesis protein CcmH